MTYLVVESGAGLSTANGYVSMETCSTYASVHGLTFTDSPSTLGEQAIIRATAALDANYRASFPGYRTSGRSQALEWPRTAAYDYEGVTITTSEVPIEVQQACCEMAVRELATPGTMKPDLDRGGAIRSLRAGSVSIEYGDSASAETVFTLIDGIMARVLGMAVSPLSGSAGRS